ncbi:hypothetical protein CPC08DRAFT_710862 [Agrocybe pediades]|nr:hypothetical protein CPC08DRAFT_710862 [Agrocybe pediades]
MIPEMKVVYPAPPPTTNELTPQQRAQLVRRARKIEQILGATPQLIDTTIRSTSPIHVSLPYALNNNTQHRLMKRRRSSIDSTSSSSSSGSFSPIHRSASVSSTASNVGVKKAHTRTSSKNSFETWPRTNATARPKLAPQSLRLEPIPASPPPPSSATSSESDSSSSTPVHSRPSSRAGANPPTFALVATEMSPRDSFVLAPIILPSANSFRKQKMDRLRKKLGSDVPFDLVFPKESETDESDSSDNYPSSENDQERRRRTTSSPSPVPSRSARKAVTKKRIASSRDSLVLDIHRAKRQAPTSSSSPKNLDKELPAVPIADFKRLKDRLSLIIESPEEHGAGCTEEFCIASAANLTSQWLISSANKTEVKLWSTRKGYEGWNLDVLDTKVDFEASPISSFTVVSGSLSSDESDSGSSSSGPSTPRTPLTPVSPTFSTELKKRPSSYRKPAPPIPAECC